jgi:hypothetical protein
MPSQTTTLFTGRITNHDEITVILIEPTDGTTTTHTGGLAATPHDSPGQPLLCCGGDRKHHRRECDGTGTTQAGGI